MKKIFLVMAVAAAAVSCKFVSINPSMFNSDSIKCNGPVETRVIEGLDSFTAFQVNGQADVKFTQASDCAVSVKANNEVFDYLDYVVEDGVLLLQTKDKVKVWAEDFEIYIRAPKLEKIDVEGASDVDIKGGYISDSPMTIVVDGAGDFEFDGIQVPVLSIEVNGAADIQAEGISVGELSVSINGAGDVDVSGKAGKASFSVQGAGDIDARRLECESVKTSKSGIASIKLH